MHIADYPTKKAFKRAVESHGSVYLSDPAVVNPCSGYVSKVLKELSSVTVTNHPKRSWYASISRHSKTGKIIVE